MAMISDERLRELGACQFNATTHDVANMVQELLTARSYIPRLQEAIRGNIETISKLNAENHKLEHTARVYAEQQAKMIDEIRELKAALRAIRDELRCLMAVQK